ncbi:GNAT family N-acetyltransferase [Emticicia sp. SJ17W-69]|uniref:GNAT family N-acetyltransferase n=1 Tax=Emticicia sp. SJ17W-69 TaxID=3421657 RepID=UPI003EBF9DC1
MKSSQFSIIQTSDINDFAKCAKMMTETDPWITLDLDYYQCLNAFEGQCKEVYLLKLGEEVAGFVILQMCGTFKGYIQTLCINQTHRGKGFGSILLNFCEEKILKFSPNIFICVSSFNVRAIKLYHKFGFKTVGNLDNFVKDGFTEILLRKTIGPMVLTKKQI